MGKYIKALEADVAARKQRLADYHAYRPDEMFRMNGEELFSVKDFWQYEYSQLLGLSAEIAEFLVARALGIDKAENVNYWTAYDMAYRNKRIEVKASVYIHPWNTKISKSRSFSIEPTNNAYWGNGSDGVSRGKIRSRQSEIYVFCLNRNKDLDHVDPLRVDDWVFYVVPTYVINNYCRNNPNQKTISLSAVQRLAKAGVGFPELRARVDSAIKESDDYYESI